MVLSCYSISIVLSGNILIFYILNKKTEESTWLPDPTTSKLLLCFVSDSSTYPDSLHSAKHWEWSGISHCHHWVWTATVWPLQVSPNTFALQSSDACGSPGYRLTQVSKSDRDWNAQTWFVSDQEWQHLPPYWNLLFLHCNFFPS